MSSHKARTQSENRDRANSVLKGGGYSPPKMPSGPKEPMPPKYASGGGVKGGPKTVNVIIKTGGGDEAAKKEGLQKGIQIGAQMASAQKPPMPPPPGAMPPPPGGPMAGPGGPPPGMPPRPGMMPPPGAGGLKTGGTVKVRSHVRRSKGGKCE